MRIVLKNSDENLEYALAELAREFPLTEGMTVKLETKQADKFILKKRGSGARIEYASYHQIFKGIGEMLAVQGKDAENEFLPAFETLAVMIDCSRNAVMTVSALKKLILYLAVFGYNQLQLYMEDTYEIKDEPYFGYLRGRYTRDELREIDDYADVFGIEVVPCIQTLAHLNQIFRWKPYAALNDCKDILMVGKEETYALLDKMIGQISSCVRSDKINIGFDEAHMVGFGKYFDGHGYRNRYELLFEHLKKVMEIIDKYRLKPIMWSDMFFKLLGDGFYYTDLPITPEVIDSVPEGAALCYWHYYTNDKKGYDRMMSRHKKFRNEIWFAGGTMAWQGFSPMNGMMEKVIDASVESCKEFDVKHYVYTDWGDGGGECPIFSSLTSMYYLGEHSYGFDKTVIKEKFLNLIGIEYDTFNLLDAPNILTKEQNVVCNPCKYIFYNDYFCGQLDKNIFVEQTFFDDNKEKLAAVAKAGRFGELFETAYGLMRILSVKHNLGIRTRSAYRTKNIKQLEEIIGDYEKLIPFLEEFYAMFERQWHTYNKPFGFDVQEVRLGGLLLRTKSCLKRLNGFLSGTLYKIEELEEEILSFTGEESTVPLRLNDWKVNVSVNVI